MNKLQHVPDRVICTVDMEGKNSHTFSDGTVIRLERNWENFNQRYVQPVNGIVISAESIPEGAEILIGHNSVHPVNQIFNYKKLSGEDIASDIKYFSVPVSECFAWNNGDGWQPLPGFAFALRVFKPYQGPLIGIPPTLLANVLYITTGAYKGKVCRMQKACDYQIIFQDRNGREGNLIRCRPDGNKKERREPEVMAIDHELTELVNSGQYLIGLLNNDAKPLNELQYA